MKETRGDDSRKEWSISKEEEQEGLGNEGVAKNG